MAWYSFLTEGTAKVIDSVGGIIDDLHTSDEEKLAAKIATQTLIKDFEVKQLELIAQYDKEITERHKNDMASDSWLSKNIRPLIIAFLTISTVTLAYLTIFILEPAMVALVEPWIDLLQILLITAYSFYFGSRGIEKVQKIRAK